MSFAEPIKSKEIESLDTSESVLSLDNQKKWGITQLRLNTRVGGGVSITPKLDSIGDMGFHVGLGMHIPFHRLFGMTVAVAFQHNQLGLLSTNDEAIKLATQNLLIPFAFRLSLPVSVVTPYLSIGGQFNYGIQSFYRQTGRDVAIQTRVDYSNHLNRYNWGLYGEVGIEITTKLGSIAFGVNYIHNFTHTLDALPTIELQDTNGNPTHLNQIMVTVGYNYYIDLKRSTKPDVIVPENGDEITQSQSSVGLPPIEIPHAKDVFPTPNLSSDRTTIYTNLLHTKPLVISVENIEYTQTERVSIFIRHHTGALICTYSGQKLAEIQWDGTDETGNMADLPVGTPILIQVAVRYLNYEGELTSEQQEVMLEYYEPKNKTITLEPLRPSITDPVEIDLEQQRLQALLQAVKDNPPQIRLVSENFSPDGDGANDMLMFEVNPLHDGLEKVISIEVRDGDCLLTRINRRGNDILFMWDGKIQGNQVLFRSNSTLTLSGSIFYPECDETVEISSKIIKVGGCLYQIRQGDRLYLTGVVELHPDSSSFSLALNTIQDLVEGGFNYPIGFPLTVKVFSNNSSYLKVIGIVEDTLLEVIEKYGRSPVDLTLNNFPRSAFQLSNLNHTCPILVQILMPVK